MFTCATGAGTAFKGKSPVTPPGVSKLAVTVLDWPFAGDVGSLIVTVFETVNVVGESGPAKVEPLVALVLKALDKPKAEILNNSLEVSS